MNACEIRSQSSREMMQMVVDYAYTREVEVNTENVQDLIPVADRFAIDGLLYD